MSAALLERVAGDDVPEVTAAASPWPLSGYNRVPRPMNPGPAPRPMRVLFLYSRPPLPMTRGDELTVSHLLEFLFARGHSVDFCALQSPGTKPLKPEHRAWLESRCRSVEVIPHGLAKAAVQAGLGILRGWPLQIGLLFSPAQRAWAEAKLAENGYDLAYAYYVRSVEALRPAHGKAKASVLALQLAQSLNAGRLAKTAATKIERLFYTFESRRVAAYEARIWQDATRVALIGKKDLAAIEDACRANGQPVIDNVIWAPHGVDTEQFRPSDPALAEPGAVVMSGVMRYAPNVEAALWFIKEAWPLIRAERPDAKFYVVGRDPVDALKALDGKDNVVVTGTVDEPSVWIAKAEVSVAPIRAAAGLQNKLLEAMAMAKPVVATSVANEGIGAEPGRDLVIADEPAETARAVLGLMNDPGRREALGRAGRAFVEAKWTWEGPFLELEKSFYEAMG